jgi:hypothetical protein
VWEPLALSKTFVIIDVPVFICVHFSRGHVQKAGLVKWYNNSFPNCGREFDSRIPHHFARFASYAVHAPYYFFDSC